VGVQGQGKAETPARAIDAGNPDYRLAEEPGGL